MGKICAIFCVIWCYIKFQISILHIFGWKMNIYPKAFIYFFKYFVAFLW